METATPPLTKDRFAIEWTAHSAVKQVTIIHKDTGRRFVGSDWSNWDIAYQSALQQAVTRRLS